MIRKAHQKKSQSLALPAGMKFIEIVSTKLISVGPSYLPVENQNT